jgi:hypothetical protein
LRLVSLALLAWAWTRIAATPGSDTPRWQAPLQALHHWVLPEFDMRRAIIARQFNAA